MIKSKVIEIIQSLDPEEIKEFGEFVGSPYFNKNTRLTELYELIKKFYPDFTKKSFTKEKLYEKLFPRKKYNDGSMRKLLSGLQSLGEEYLAHSHLDKNNKLQKKLFLLNEFDLRKLDRLFEINFEIPFFLMPTARKPVKMGRYKINGVIQPVGHFSNVEYVKKEMGIDWMTQAELSQAIPPAYTEFIGRHLMNILEVRDDLELSRYEIISSR